MKSLRLLFLVVPFLLSSEIQAVPGDSDNDGIANAIDKCPNTAQLRMLPPDYKFAPAVNPERVRSIPLAHPVNKYGCELDTDNDGIINSKDYCPENTKDQLAMGVADNGCPVHSDTDGTPDYRDKCPNTPRGVATDSDGCPKS